ncbi:MAG TPA: hypothetical protein VGH14_16830 [Solirubrobacterales bacterium]
MADLTTSFAGLSLKNPVIAGSCELTMDEAGIAACVAAGAGAVVAKSINESPAAAEQLDRADYVLLDAAWREVPWRSGRADATLFNRSGLAQTDLAGWCAMLGRSQRVAAESGSMVIGSITVGAAAAAAEIARALGEVVPAIELNVGAPHGRESSAISQMTDSEAVAECVRGVRAAVECPLIVKLPGQAGDVIGLARAAAAAGADAVTLIGRFNGFMPDLETWDPVLGSWGAIGGGWSLPLSLYWVSKCHRELAGTPLIGTNGARDGGDVVRFLLSGARAVELVSLLFALGPGAISTVLEELDACLSGQGVENLSEIIGVSAARARRYSEIPPIGNPKPWAEVGR